MKKKNLAALFVLGLWLSIPTQAQTGYPDMSGMWSDPPRTLEGMLCFFACFDDSEEKLYALLDDPANDATPVPVLVFGVMQQNLVENIEPLLTAAGKADFPLDQSKDPGFTECEPWGFAREIFAPHQLRIEQQPDYIEMQYGEWDITRRVYLEGSHKPENITHSPMGYSVAHYEGDMLVIETSHVTENIFLSVTNHSDQLTAVERYHKSEDGQVLHMQATLEDPLTLTAPVTANKMWGWAPDQEIYAYDSCKIPDPDLLIEGVSL